MLDWNKESEHISNGRLLWHSIHQGEVSSNLVAVSSATAFFLKVARLLKVVHDLEGTPLCDIKVLGEVAKTQRRVLCYLYQSPSMTGKESPLGGWNTVWWWNCIASNNFLEYRLYLQLPALQLDIELIQLQSV